MRTNSDKNNLISTIKYEERVQKRKERKRKSPNYLPINSTILGKMNSIIEDYFNKSHSASQDIIFQSATQKEKQKESENAIIRNIMKKEMSKKFRDQDSLHSHLQKYLDFQKSKQSKSTQLPKIHSRQINTTKDLGKARKIQLNRKPNGEIEKILYKCMLSQKRSNKEKSLIHKRINKFESKVGAYVRMANNIIFKNEKMENGEQDFKEQLERDKKLHKKLILP